MQHHFVARQIELERMSTLLKAAVSGSGQVVFILGEPGSGKTALFHEFARQARLSHTDLLVSAGLCNSQSAFQTPYSPFREIMNGLADPAEKPRSKQPEKGTPAKVSSALGLFADAVMEFGPDLIGIFIPGASLVARVGAFAMGQTGLVDKLKSQAAAKESKPSASASQGLTQDQLFEQYINVIHALSQKAPLLLLLDDLQWADTASIDLLFRLCRRLDGMRVLLVGTYRPVEVMAGRQGERHPLEKVLNEIRRYQGDVTLDLNLARERRGREFIDTYLDSLPSRFDLAFRDSLYKHTGGHPLFTVELLHDLRDRGLVAVDEQGYWDLGGPIRWERLPARVEGVIAERIQALGADLRESLLIASVEGEAFTAEVVAKVHSQEVREVVKRFSTELEKLHQLVQGTDVQRVGGQRISNYRFSHNLVQQFVYGGADPIERSFLHESVGLALEELYGEQAGLVADQLAHHFDLADLPEKAAHYYRLAGSKASDSFANDQALFYFNRALELTPPGGRADQFSILWLRERVYDLQGQRGLQQADLQEIARLLSFLPPDGKIAAELSLRKARLALDQSDYPAVLAITSEVISALQADHPESARLVVEGILLKARAIDLQGDQFQAGEILESALVLARQFSLAASECKVLEQLGTVRWAAGDYAQACSHLEASLGLARGFGLIRREWSILNNLGVVASSRKDYSQAASCYSRALQIVQRVGDRMGEMILDSNLGEVNLYRHRYMEACEHARNAYKLADELGNRFARGITLINIGETYREMGDYPAAEDYANRALGELREVNYRLGLSIVLQNLGRIALARGDLHKALEFAGEAMMISEEIDSPENLASSLILAGMAAIALGNLPDAMQALEKAQALTQKGNDPVLTWTARSGIAWAACSRAKPGDNLIAAGLVDEIWAASGLGSGQALAEDYALSIIWPCIRVMKVQQDPRLSRVLGAVRVLIEGRADRITDPTLKHLYLHVIPEHAAFIFGPGPVQNPQ